MIHGGGLRDVVKHVWESTKGEWVGDVDLNDGQLEYLISNSRNSSSGQKQLA